MTDTNRSTHASVIATPAPSSAPPVGTLYGVVAEFESAGALLEGLRLVRAMGFTRFDAYSPYPIHGLDAAMGMPRSRLPWIVLVLGLAGMACGFLLQWWTGAVDYPLVIGGKPLFAFEFSVPVAFELTILLAAFGAVFGMLALNGLPKLYHPVFNYSVFRRASDDGFFLAIEATDPLFEREKGMGFLQSIGGKNVSLVEE